ncbi:MAG: hypothetical protein ACT4O9_03670 [Blastocatellia bacterium]
MNCRDFNDIADSYLSNELLVETNHEVLRHIENCGDCRNELAARRELRDRLRIAIKEASESHINPGFATRVRSSLREQAFNRRWALNGFLSPVVLSGSAFALVLTLALVFILRPSETPKVVDVNPQTPSSANEVNEKTLPFQMASYVKVRNDAIDDHNNCALKHNLDEDPISLKEAGKRYGKANIGLETAVLAPLKETFGKEIKIVTAHYCLINRRYFAHVVLKQRQKVVSVLMTPKENYTGTADDVIACGTSGDLQVACFETERYSLFVVSDKPEAENLIIARTVSNSIREHIAKSEPSA